MAYKPGESGNISGRKKGSSNKSTSELREFIQSIVARNFSKSKITGDLNALPPKLRLQMFFKLLDYVLPKPTPEEIKENTSKSNYYANIARMLRKDPDS